MDFLGLCARIRCWWSRLAGQFYFARAERDDDFGKAITIETAGGGVEAGEDLITAIRRELKEELGVQVADTSLGKLIANRELPVLHRAKEIIEAGF